LYGIHIAENISTPLKLACGVFAFGFDQSLDLHKCRLCQELVLQKAPLAELVFPHVLGNLAARFESSSEFCRKFSEQVEEHVFGERNNSTRSIQLFLGAMNCLRCCYITANMNHSSTAPSRGRDSKGEKSLGNGGETGTGSARKRRSDHGDAEKGGSEPGNQHHWIRSSWQKVYWLQIDYLSTARAAQRCGAYFTTVLYMENWCEETFGRLTLGEPDFSINDAVCLSTHPKPTMIDCLGVLGKLLVPIFWEVSFLGCS
jgi:ataxia telangiectasia mutated family protein